MNKPRIEKKLNIDVLCDKADYHLDCRGSAPTSVEELTMYALVEMAKSLRGLSYVLDDRLEKLT